MKVRTIDLFGGIGGIRRGFELAGKDLGVGVECVFYADIDKHAIAVYNHQFKEKNGPVDVFKAEPDKIPQYDISLAGFPCQSFSMIGRREGFTSSTKGTLFFEILRLAQYHKPVMLFLENVKGLLSAQGGYCVETIMRSLNECGYIPDFRVLNSVNFGVPQNRERIYIVATHVRVLLGESRLADTLAEGILIERALKVLTEGNDRAGVLRANGLPWLVLDFLPKDMTFVLGKRPELKKMAEAFGGEVKQTRFVDSGETPVELMPEEKGVEATIDNDVIDWMDGGDCGKLLSKSIWSHSDIEGMLLGYVLRHWGEFKPWMEDKILELVRIRGEVGARGGAKDIVDEAGDVRVHAFSLVRTRRETRPLDGYSTDRSGPQEVRGEARVAPESG